MTTGITCTVYVDGVRAADGSPGDNLLDPIILENLAVQWGRSDTMSQPNPDTCSFDVMDQLGGQAFMEAYRVGRRIDVVASGEGFADPSDETFLNPDFESESVTWQATGGTATRQNRRAHTGLYALALTPDTGGTSARVLLAPAPFSAPGTEPDAWDAIPTTSIGQTWGASIDLWLPTGASATVRGVSFTGPYANTASVGTVPHGLTGDGAWHTIAWDETVATDGRWVGLQVELWPTGPAWDDMPPTLTWDGVDPTWAWDDMGSVFIDAVSVLTPPTGTVRQVEVFVGRITDMSAQWDEGLGCPVVSVTALGFTADLDNRTVGDEPWPVETVDVRTNRILDVAGLPITIDIDTSIDDMLLSWRDVDAQGATGLLQSIATSVDGVLWPAVHRTLGAYLRLEDPSMRASLLRLEQLDGPPAEVLHTNEATNPDAEAYGALSTVRTNALNNPSMETAITGWQVAGASTLARVNTDAWSGTWCLQVTTTGSGQGASFQVSQTAAATVVSTAYVAAYVKAPAGTTITIRGEEYTPPSTTVRTSTAAFVATGAWQRVALAHTGVAVGNVVRPGIILSAAGVMLIDAVIVEYNGAPDWPYFDGSTPAAGDFVNSWSSTAHASTSLQRAPAATGVGAWSGGNGRRWSSVSEHTRGSRSFAVQRALPAQTGFIWSTPGTVLAGQWVTIRARVKAAVGVAYLVSARTSGGGSAGNTNYVGTGAWQDVYATAASATDGALIGAQLVVNTNGATVYVDEVAVLVEGSAYTGPYFDGRTPSTDVVAFAWTGAADASSSTWSTVQTHTIVIVQSDPDTGFNLSACVVLRDPVTWVQDVSDVVTRVAVGWKVQGTDDEGNPTTSDATEQVVDADMEVLYGTRRVQVSTELQSATDAANVASRVLARTSDTDWRAEGITIDDDDVETGNAGTTLVLDMLDGTSRIGAPVVLGDLPVWTPAGSVAGVYLEGGTYRFIGGRWVLDLVLSSAAGLGQSAQWDQLDPAWTWDDWDPGITWNDLRGVAAP